MKKKIIKLKILNLKNVISIIYEKKKLKNKKS